MSQGERIKALLKENRITQQDLADKMGKDRTQITRMLSQGAVSKEVKINVAEMLSMSEADLIVEINSPSEQSDYVKKLESDVEHLKEIRDGLKRENAKNEEIILARDEEIARLKAELQGREVGNG